MRNIKTVKEKAANDLRLVTSLPLMCKIGIQKVKTLLNNCLFSTLMSHILSKFMMSVLCDDL